MEFATIIALITAIASFITAIAAIIAPVFTTHLNNKTQFKLKTLEMFYNEKSKAYQNFCTSISIVLDSVSTGGASVGQWKECLKSHQIAYLMADNKTRSLLEELGLFLKYPINTVEINKLVKEITKSMNNDLSNDRNHI